MVELLEDEAGIDLRKNGVSLCYQGLEKEASGRRRSLLGAGGTEAGTLGGLECR
jgi:hypothetical protein